MNARIQRAKYIFSDLIATTIGWTFFYVYRYDVTGHLSSNSLTEFLTSPPVMLNLTCAPFLWLALFAYSGYYQNPYFKSLLDELQNTCATILTGTLLFFFAIVIDDVPWIDEQRLGFIKLVHVSPRVYLQIVFTMFSSVFLPVYLGRYFITQTSNKRIQKGKLGLRTLLVGNGKAAQQLLKELNNAKRSNGYTIVGCIDSGYEKTIRNLGIPTLGDIRSIAHIVQEHHIEAFLLAPDIRSPKTTYKLVYELLPFDCPIRIQASTEEILTGQVRTGSLTTIPMVEYGSTHTKPFRRNLKRTVDILASLFALVILSPLFCMLAYLIRKDSKGPVFFKQERIGQCGRPFIMYKFRSMYNNAEENGPQLATNQDQRITRLGHTLRKYRLDELPQFWNVLIGDMSLVGPRPERAFFIKQIMEIAPYYSKLLQIRPGITSWGMVKFGYASNVFQMVERLRYELMYLDNNSLAVDLKIIVYTVRTVLTGKGV